MSLPDMAEAWQRPTRNPPVLLKGRCKCKAPKPFSTDSSHCKVCKKYIDRGILKDEIEE